MTINKITVSLPYDVGRIWKLVTDTSAADWRSDLDGIEPDGDGAGFTEYDRKGRATHFSVTLREPCRRYELDMENAAMSGRWVGLFAYANGVTTLEFTEYVNGKRLWVRLFAKRYLKKQQARYLRDLRAALDVASEG